MSGATGEDKVFACGTKTLDELHAISTSRYCLNALDLYASLMHIDAYENDT